MQERNFCSKSMIVTSDANDFVLEKAMQERDLCWQGNHYVTSPSPFPSTFALSRITRERLMACAVVTIPALIPLS